MVGVVTPEHVIVANLGDSRAILVMVAADHKTGGANKSATGSKGNSKSGKGLENKKGAAETIAAALGLRLGAGGAGGDGGGSRGVAEEKGEGATAAAAAIAAEAEAEAEAEAGGGELNDSVRLEEQEEEDEDGCDFEGADKIRELLEAMMLGEAGGGGGGGEEEGGARVAAAGGARGGGGGGGGAAERRGGGEAGDDGVMVTAISRDHTAKDEAERERVTAAGGKAFEVPYTEDDGRECVVSEENKRLKSKIRVPPFI